MDAELDIPRMDTECRGGIRIVDGLHLLDFEVMVARTERAHLVQLAFFCAFRDL